MSYDNDNGGELRQRRPMNDVSNLDLSCVECGTGITELPFMPTKKEDGTFGKIYCRECSVQRRGRSSSGSGGGFQQRSFQMNDVSGLKLSCVECGTSITELPFMPTKKEDGTFGKIYCRECNRKRPRRFDGPRRFDN